MSNAAAELSKRHVELGEHLRQRASSRSFQVSTWILVGHAAGAYFLLSSARDKAFAANVPTPELYAVFLAGMLSAILSMILGIRYDDRLAAGSLLFSYDVTRYQELTQHLNASRLKEPALVDQLGQITNRITTFEAWATKKPWTAHLSKWLSYVSLLLLGAGLASPLLLGLLRPPAA
jgi:hypothetical protein